MRWISGTSAAFLVLLVITGCGGSEPAQLRDATEDDLETMTLSEDDFGSSFRRLDGGLLGCVSPDDPQPSCNPIYQVSFEPTSTQDDATACIYSELQAFSSADSARRGFEFVVEGLNQRTNDDESSAWSPIRPDDLVGKAVAYHIGQGHPLCAAASTTTQAYGVTILRGNVHAVVQAWSSKDQGPELAVSLAHKQAEHIEEVLAEK